MAGDGGGSDVAFAVKEWVYPLFGLTGVNATVCYILSFMLMLFSKYLVCLVVYFNSISGCGNLDLLVILLCISRIKK